MISYEVLPLSPESHLFQVNLILSEPTPAGQKLSMPAWIRGSYKIRDFARNVVSIEARCKGVSVPLTKLDKQTWFVNPCASTLRITYTIYAWDLSVRAAHLDTTHAYFNGSSLFLAPEGKRDEPCELTLLPAEHPASVFWRVATAMPVKEIDSKGYGTYTFSDYEALLDHPVEMGDLDFNSFSVVETEHRFVVCGRQHADIARICADLTKVCSKHVELFGELPVDQYLFLLWVVGDGYGGLEHRNSTSLLYSRDDLPGFDMHDMTEGYRRLLGLCSHEYFHLWNVKRIMPAVFQAEGTSHEVYTRQLWIFEGITSYYDELALVRSGVIDRKNYLEMLAETITRVMRGSGRLKQTLEESSFDAWTKFYQQDENAPNAIVSYYAKGAVFALVLDLHIRLQTAGGKSLDDIMRRLWQQYGKQGMGVPEGGFEQLAVEVAGIELSELFELGIRSTSDLPLAGLLEQFGVEMRLLPARSSVDKGYLADKPPEVKPAKRVLGARVATTNNEIKLLQVFDGQAAQAAGLSAGDSIVAVAGLRLNEKQLERYIAANPLDQPIRIHAFRRDELMEFELISRPAPADTCVFYLPEAMPMVQTQRLNAWLHADG